MSEQLLKEILNEIKSMKTDISSIRSDVSVITTRLDNLESQQKENNRLIGALMHRTETIGAEINGLKITTASNDAIAQLETKIDKVLAIQTIQGEFINILSLRQLKAESEVAALKKSRRISIKKHSQLCWSA